jgi:regulator of sigma E protease
MFSHIVTDAVVVAVVLGFLIFIHEAGHFTAAKYFGVRAPVFSIGFGKRLIGFERAGTDYRISLLPFGGYVRLVGEDPADPNSQNDPGNLLAHPRWQRFIISFAGPAVNIVAAVVLLTLLYTFHYVRPAYEAQPARIGAVDPASPAEKAGLKPGDLIVRMGSEVKPTWENVEMKVLLTTRQSIPLEVLRDGKVLPLSLAPRADGVDGAGYAGILPCLSNVAAKVEAGSPASHAGVEPGDQLWAVDGQQTPCFEQISTAIQAKHGKAVDLTVKRKGKFVDFTIQPIMDKADGEARWILGVSRSTGMAVRELPLGQAFTASVSKNVSFAVLEYTALKEVLTRQMSAKSMAGPVGIAQMSGEAYRAGLADLVGFVAFISLDLAIVNLLPIPVLDGGTILVLLIEGAMQRDLSLRFKERILQAGIFLILLVFVLITYNDIVRALAH